MSRTFTFTVKGDAQPAGSKKAFVPLHPKTKQPYRRPGGGIMVSVVDDNPRSKGWKKVVAKIATEECGTPLLTGPLRVTMTFYRQRPQGHYGVSGLSKAGREAPYPITKPDAGKLARGTIDAMTGVIYVDDAQVVEEIAIKRYGEPPRVEVTIEEIEPPEAHDQTSLFEALPLPPPWEIAGAADARQKASDGRPDLTSGAGKIDDRCDGGTDHSAHSHETDGPPWETQQQETAVKVEKKARER